MHRPTAVAALMLAALAAPALAQTTTGPFVHPGTGDRYYRLSSAPVGFATAVIASRGGTLAVIQDGPTNEWIRETVAQADGNTLACFIGLGDAAVEGSYVWANGEKPAITRWAVGQPDNAGNEDYTVIDPASGLWSDVSDAAVRPAIYQITGDIRVPDEFPTIQAAIDAAVDGQTILVSPGVYHEPIDFGYKKLTVRSMLGPASTTIIAAPGAYSLVMAGGQGAETVLEGFTLLPDPAGTATLVLAGDGQTVRNCRLSNPGGVAVELRGTSTLSDSLIVGTSLAVLAQTLGPRLDALVQNCTLAGNNRAAVVRDNGVPVPATLRLANSATIGNVAPFAAVGPANLFFFSNVVAEGPINNNNLYANPGFVNAPGPDGVYGLDDDYSLRADSPCIDAGNNVRRRPLLSLAAPADLTGAPRFVDVPNIADIGGGPGPVVDVGAFEFSPSADSCLIDFNNDGFVDFFDYDDFVAAFEVGC